MDTLYPIHPWNQTLWQELTAESERSSHALLFCGNSGLGKRDLAINLAFKVITQNHPQSLTLFNASSHPDFHVLMPEIELGEDIVSIAANRYIEEHKGKPKKQISIGQIRTLNNAITTRPHISKNRVVLILSAELMNRNASNALLKNLEEPPADTLFILVTNEASKISKTIRSRCNLITLRTPETEQATQWLQQQNKLPETEIGTYLSMAGGSPLLAMQLFDNKFMDKLKAVFTDVNGLWARRANPVDVAKSWQTLGGNIAFDILQKMIVDIIRLSMTPAPAALFFPAQSKWLTSVAAKLSRAKLLAFTDSLNDAKKLMATSVDELLVLETLSTKLCDLPKTSN